MLTASATRPAPRLRALVARLRQALAAAARRRADRRACDALLYYADWQLADIGLTRADVIRARAEPDRLRHL